MPVEQLRSSDIARLEKAMHDHDEQDNRRFGTLESQQARMAGSLDVLVDNQAAMMSAFGVRKDGEERTHKPVALMSQGSLLLKIGGAMGGLLVAEKVAVAVWPYLIGMLKAVANIH